MPSRHSFWGTNTVSLGKTILAVAALVALALSASGCGGKSEADVTRCVEKKGLVVRHQTIRVRHVSGGVTSPLRVTTSVAPALVIKTETDRATVVFAKTREQARDAGFDTGESGTFTVDYGGHVVVVWDSEPRRDEARPVEGCLS